MPCHGINDNFTHTAGAVAAKRTAGSNRMTWAAIGYTRTPRSACDIARFSVFFADHHVETIGLTEDT